MSNFVRWYVQMEPFYKILFLGSMLVGTLAVVFGTATQNPVFLLFGFAWLGGGPGTLWVVTRFGPE
jgi:hypothetical protein